MYYGTPPIVTNGLVLNLDAQNPQSIPLDPTVNLIRINPTPISNLTGYDYAYGSPTASYNAVSQSVEIETSNSPVGWIVNNTSLNSTVLDTRSLYTISFEWKPESDNTSLCRIWPQIVTGNNATSSYSGVMRNSGSSAVTSQNTLLPNGWYLFSQTFTPSHPGVNGDRSFRLLGGDVGGGQKLHIHWRKLQLERTPYRTPFVSGSYQAWYDLSGNNNTATLLSSSISGGIPVFPAANNRVLQFDGTGSYADTNLDLGWGTGSSVTLEMWIKSSGTSSAAFLGTTQFEWQIKQGVGASSAKNNNLVYVYWDTTGNHTNGPVINVNDYFDNNWKHLVVTWNSGSSTTSIYRNGILMTAQTSSNPSANRSVNQTTKIGGNIYSWGGSDAFWSGSISNVRTYNRALSQAEITQNYNAYKSRYGLT
jgi:hypothetical protein